MKKTIKFLTALFGSASLLMSVPALAEYRTFDDGNITYGIFQAKPEEVQLHWKDAEGKDYQSLTRLKNALEPSYNVKMIMNAGIYSMNNTPAGLWIEHGKELNALNTKSGKGLSLIHIFRKVDNIADAFDFFIFDKLCNFFH